MKTDSHQEEQWVAAYFQNPINYSNGTSTLPLTFQLFDNPLGTLQRVMKNKEEILYQRVAKVI